MKVVIDTNVLVSGLHSPWGTCAQVVDLLLQGVIRPCVNGQILDEYDSVLHRAELEIASKYADEVIAYLRRAAENVPSAPVPSRLTHTHDQPFLEVAWAAGAAIVTGNTRHFPKRLCGDVEVLTPAELIEQLRREE
jgi:uncharacterized protein